MGSSRGCAGYSALKTQLAMAYSIDPLTGDHAMTPGLFSLNYRPWSFRYKQFTSKSGSIRSEFMCAASQIASREAQPVPVH
jgi:hypothetical protein